MKKVELKDILEYKFLSDIKYSPDEKAAAFVVSYAVEEDNKYEGHIWVYENGKVRQLTGLGKERSFFWEDDTHILFQAARSEAELKEAKEGMEVKSNFYRIDIHGGEAVKAFTLPLGVQNMKRIDENTWMFTGGIEVEYPDYYKMTAEERAEVGKKKKEDTDYEVFDESPFWFNGAGVVNGQRTALFLYHLDTQEIERITEPRFDVGDFVHINGKIHYTGAAFTCKRPMLSGYYTYDLETKKTEALYVNEEISVDRIVDFGETPLLIASEHDKHGLNQNACMFRIIDGKMTQVFDPVYSLYGSVGSDCRLGGGQISAAADRWYYVTTRRNAAQIYAFTKDNTEEPVFTEEGSVDCFDVKKDGSELLFIGMLEQKLQELYVLKDGKATQVSHFNEDALKDRYVAVPEKMTIQSEGTDIDGWVLKPIDFDENKKYPAILDVHGGPKTVYGEVFYHEMQLWASEGYFVFFCNPTGSDGRGDEFADIRGKYGTIDFKNLMDFTDAVLEKYPQIDKDRVGETGGSYGGFMTNWIVGHTDRFACAATQRSISNWVSFYGISDIGPEFSMDQTGGNIEENIEKMWEHSPLKYVNNVTTPLLFIHSDEDYRCPMSQGIQFYTALIQRNQLARMCLFHGENHELSRSGKPKHRVRRLTEITDWMNRFLHK